MRSYLTGLIYILAALILTQVTHAEIYKTVDKQGHVVYTDQPSANTNAKIVELPKINSLPPTQAMPDEVPAANPTAADVNYQVSILNPVSGVTLQADERILNVAVGLDQPLQSGHLLAYFLDGNLVEKTTATNITINEPPRGEHKLHVEVVSKYGKSLGQSNPVTFIVFRPQANQKSGKVPAKH